MKNRNIGKHECYYCGFRSNDLDVIKEHEERIHGCFRNVNPRKASRNKKSVDNKQKKDILLNGLYRWDKQTRNYEEVKKNSEHYPINVGQTDFYEDGAGNFHYKCQNCGYYSVFSQYPYIIQSFCSGRKPPIIKRKMSENEHPLILCSHCGLNIFKDNRARIYPLLSEGKLPESINAEVVKSCDKDVYKSFMGESDGGW